METMENMETLSGDVLDINNEFGTYREYKAAVDAELQKSAESFVRIGYLLKVARDTDILTESGYGSVNEFAEKEYNLDKSQVSRFIRINDEFSENGYSDRLQERYRAFGYAKLALMLMLPAVVNEELTADFTKAEINTIKAEIDEEKTRTDLEVMMEEKDVRQQSFDSFGKAIYEIGKNNPETYLKIYDAIVDTACGGMIKPVVNKLMDILAPAGEAIISLRIQGEGKKMLSIKGPDIDPVLVDIRSGGKQECTWKQLIEEIETLCCNGENGRESWEYIYGVPFPEKKEEVAPVQPQKRPESNKVSRVTKAKKPEKTITEPPREQKEAAGEKRQEESKENEGDDAEDNGPAVENQSENEQDGTGGGEGTGDIETGTGHAEAGAELEDEEQLEGNPCGGEAGKGQNEEQLKKNIRENLQALTERISKEDWDGTIDVAYKIIDIADNLIRKENQKSAETELQKMNEAEEDKV